MSKLSTLLILFFACFFAQRFTVAAQTSPLQNGDFENWTTTSHSEPVGWSFTKIYIGNSYVTNCSQVTGVTNSAIRLESSSQAGGVASEVYSGNVFNGKGGLPYTGTSQPTHFTGKYRYNLLSNDTAGFYVFTKKNGVIISRDTFLVLGSQVSFTSFNFQLSPMSLVPDSVMIYATTRYTRAPYAQAHAGSFMELDDLTLTNGSGTYPVLNGGFDSWTTTTMETPDLWGVAGAAKTTDKYSGNYALKLTSQDNGSGLETGALYGSTTSTGPYIDTLTGYIKYSPVGNDNGYIEIILNDAGHAHVSTIALNVGARSSYGYFSIPLANTINARDFSFEILSSGGIPANGSTLYLDKLALKSGNPTAVNTVFLTAINDIVCIPNPAHNNVILKENTALPVGSKYAVLNSIGQEVRSGAMHAKLSIDLSSFPAGEYFIKAVSPSGVKHSGRFIKE